MNRYQILGRDPESGKPLEPLVVDAEDEEVARNRATEMGMAVDRVVNTAKIVAPAGTAAAGTSQQRQTLKSVRRALCLPRISGLQSFLTLLLCMGITALLVPMALALPVWIEAEIVIASWWLIWCVTLTLLLYNGWLVTHDFQKPELSSWRPSTASANNSYDRGWWDGFFWGSFPDFGATGDNPIVGCLLLIVLIVLLPFIIVFVIEAAILVAFVMYLMIRGMLAQVANTRLRCRGRPGRSLAFSVLWATLYTVPLGGLVWFIHQLHGGK